MENLIGLKGNNFPFVHNLSLVLQASRNSNERKEIKREKSKEKKNSCCYYSRIISLLKLLRNREEKKEETVGMKDFDVSEKQLGSFKLQ